MRKLIFPVITFLIGICFIALSVLRGQAEFGLLLIFPIVFGGGFYLLIGVLFVILSLILPFIISFIGAEKPHREGYNIEREKSEMKYGGVIFIGPIPIVFGKDKSITAKMMYIGLAIAVLLMIVYLIIIFT